MGKNKSTVSDGVNTTDKTQKLEENLNMPSGIKKPKKAR